MAANEKSLKHALSSFIGRKRNIVQFGLMLLDKLFFHNFSESINILYLVEGDGNKIWGFISTTARNMLAPA